MGVYRRSDSSTWWMSLQLNGQRVRRNTMVEDRQLAEEFFCAWKAEIARVRWSRTLSRCRPYRRGTPHTISQDGDTSKVLGFPRP